MAYTYRSSSVPSKTRKLSIKTKVLLLTGVVITLLVIAVTTIMFGYSKKSLVA